MLLDSHVDKEINTEADFQSILHGVVKMSKYSNNNIKHNVTSQKITKY